MRARLSSSDSWALLKNCASFVVPVGPPSALAPLSEMTIERVLGLTLFAQEVQQAPHLRVGVAEETREDLQPARRFRLRVPVGDIRVVAGQFRVGGGDAQLLLLGEDLLPVGIPAVVELTRVPVCPFLGDVVR